MELKRFKEKVGIEESFDDRSMIQCSKCQLKWGIKKWAAASDDDHIRCPCCGATADNNKKAKIIPKEPSRFVQPRTCPECGKTLDLIEWMMLIRKKALDCVGCCELFKSEVKPGEASVEIRSDGTKLYKETVYVTVRPKIRTKG